MRSTDKVELINFQDNTHNCDFDTYYARKTFRLAENLVGRQYLEVLRILVPQFFLKKLRSTAYVKLINFQDSIQENSGHLPEFTRKSSAEPLYMCRILEYLFPLRY